MAARGGQQDPGLVAARERHAEQWSAQRAGAGGAAAGSSSSSSSSRGGPLASLRRWLARHRWAVGAAVGGAALFLTRPDAASFRRFVRSREASAAASLTAGVWQLVEGAVGATKFTDYKVVATAKYGGRVFLGVLGCWFRLPSGPSDDIEVLALANAAVFAAWHLAPRRAMEDHFVASEYNLKRGRPWTLVTSALSHESVMHLVANVQNLLVLGPQVQGVLGRRRFLALYLGGGAFAAAATIVWHKLTRRPHGGSLGASGAGFSLLAFNAMMLPHATVSYWGGYELSAREFVATQLAVEVIDRAYSRRGIDVAMHIGGAAFGVVFYHLLTASPRAW